MPLPLTIMPTVSPLVEVRSVTTAPPCVVLPEMVPAENRRITPLLEELAATDSVMLLLAGVTAVIVVPSGMPSPVTRMPMARPAVEERFVTASVPLLVVPVKPRAEKASATPLVEAVAAVDSVMLLLVVLTSVIVVPAGMPAAVTGMPTDKPAVEGRLVTRMVPLVVPVMGSTDELPGNESATKSTGALAGCDSVMLLLVVLTSVISVPAGMPAPVTSMPVAKPTVLRSPVTIAVTLVVPVKALGLLTPTGTGPAENVSPTPSGLVTVAAADSVIEEVAKLIA